MNISELIARYGDDRVECQPLDGCIRAIDYHHKKGTTITFGTDAQIGPNGMEKMGLVLWMDRKIVADLIAADKASAGHPVGANLHE